MADLQHEFSWSVSRAGTFARCKRHYYYDYYASWLGWGRMAPEERKQPYLLKKMTRMPMLAGDVLHVALEEWFQARLRGKTPTHEETVKSALGMLRQRYKESRDGLWKQRPAKLTRLAEHHFEEECIDEKTGAAKTYGTTYVQRIEKGLDVFFNSEDLRPCREADPMNYLALEEMGTIDLHGNRVFAIPDFAYRDGETVWIWDWKTGSPREQDRFQLGTYVLYAGEKWGTAPENVACVDAYLTRDELEVQRFTGDELAELDARIETSMIGMKELHFDAGQTLGNKDSYPMIEEGSPEMRECERCNYRGLCGRD